MSKYLTRLNQTKVYMNVSMRVKSAKTKMPGNHVIEIHYKRGPHLDKTKVYQLKEQEVSRIDETFEKVSSFYFNKGAEIQPKMA